MTLPNFIKSHTINKRGATKLIVRDLDEIEKNAFVAYVDENNMSYDVKIVLDTKLNVIENSCDCEQIGVCQHLVALADHLKNNKKEKVIVKTVRKKKATEIDLLFEEQNQDEVLLWLKNMLNTNKEWALVFKQNFSSKNIELNNDAINKTILECFVSIAGRRKKIESNEVKKIVDAIESSLKPYFEIVLNNINLENYQWFWVIINLLNGYENTYKHNSSRLKTLIEKIKDNYCLHFLNSKTTENWQEILNFQINEILHEKINVEQLHFFKKLYHSSKEDSLKKQFIFKIFEDFITSFFSKEKKDFYSIRHEVEQLILLVITDAQLFEKYYENFKPQKYNNDYNINLIQNLIQIEQYDLAKKYCVEQIDGNYKEEYNLPYYQLLEQIYKIAENTDALTQLYLKIGSFTFDYNIYLHLKQHASDIDFQKYYYKVSTKVKDAAKYGNRAAFDYFYQMKKDKNKDHDILDLFRKITNIDLITDYLEIASKMDATTFLKNLFDADIYKYNNSDEKLNKLISNIFETIPLEIIKKAIKSHKGYWENEVFRMLKAKIVAD